jgi:3-dehydroquinate dehydratase / shikimate dehydrogenase
VTDLCVTLTEETTSGLVERMAALAGIADLFEIRADRVLDLDLLALLRARTRPLVLTCRSVSQGGSWPDDDPRRRLTLLEAAKRGFDYVDVEADSGYFEVIGEKAGRGLIVSHHDLSGTPADLDGLYARLRGLGADIVKIAVTPRSMADVGRLLDCAARAARGGGPPLLAVAMGEMGAISRVAAGRHGAPFTFAAPEAGAEGAPGQIPVATMASLFRARTISPSTRVYGILGRDVTRSFSPALHNPAFQACGLDAVYVTLQSEALAPFLDALPSLSLSGFSVTQPYKVEILPYLDTVDAAAAACGSVNTVICEEGRLKGATTDGAGVVGPLRRRLELNGTRVMVVGAGGAARSAAFALRAAGARVTVVARDPARAGAVAEAARCAHGALADLARYEWDVLVNATPVGGRSQPDVSPVPEDLLRPGTVVFDMVYDPLETPLLRQAQRRGCSLVDGLEMLLAQAALQFEAWTGQPAPMDAMKSAALYLAQERA